MQIEVVVPDLGEDVDEGTVSFWHKEEGDDVEEGEDLVGIETDSGFISIPSPATGILSRILVEEGDTVSVGDVVAIIEEE